MDGQLVYWSALLTPIVLILAYIGLRRRMDWYSLAVQQVINVLVLRQSDEIKERLREIEEVLTRLERDIRAEFTARNMPPVKDPRTGHNGETR